VLAEATRSAYHQQDAFALQEPGWRSLGVENMFEEWIRREPRGRDAVERGVLVLDEMKMRIPPGATDNTRTKREGSQNALLSLLGTGVPVSVGEDGEQLRSDRMLIILTEAFADAPWAGRAPTPTELEAYGWMGQLVDRLSSIVYLPPPPPDLLARVYAEGPTSVAAAESVLAEQLGYQLAVEAETYRYAATAVRQGHVAVGLRAGGFWVATAVRRALTRALRDSLPPGSVIRVTPDDLEIPPADAPPPPSQDGRWGHGDGALK
jgi:hypothetical protein